MTEHFVDRRRRPSGHAGRADAAPAKLRGRNHVARRGAVRRRISDRRCRRSTSSGETPRERLLLRPAAFYAEKGVALEARRASRGSRLEQRTRYACATVARSRYDRCCSRPAAAPRTLAVPGADLAGVHYLRTIADVDAHHRMACTPGARVLCRRRLHRPRGGVGARASAASTSRCSRRPSARARARGLRGGLGVLRPMRIAQLASTIH